MMSRRYAAKDCLYKRQSRDGVLRRERAPLQAAAQAACLANSNEFAATNGELFVLLDMNSVERVTAGDSLGRMAVRCGILFASAPRTSALQQPR